MNFQEWLLTSKHYRVDVLGLSPDVEQHLLIIHTNNAQGPWDISVQLKEYNKFSASIIFFVLDGKTLLGYVTWEIAAGVYPSGYGVIKHLKQIGTVQYVVFPWEVELEQHLFKRVEQVPAYRLTCLGDISSLNILGNVRMDLVERRLLAETLLEIDTSDAGSRGFVDMLLHVGQCTELAERRAELERLSFWDSMKHLTERATLKWLRANGMDLMKHWVAPTARDLQVFIARHNPQTPQELPTGCFALPYEDDPLGGPLYSGGTCHLSYRDVPAWAWGRYMYFKDHLSKVNVDILGDERVQHLLRLCMEVSKRYKQGLKTLAPSSAASLTDIEDLLNGGACPPCVANKIRERKHYMHEERTMLVVQLRSGRVPLSVVTKIFEGDEEQTWDYKHCYEKSLLFKPKPCSVFVENARRNAPAAIHCAYASEGNPEAACQAAFRNAHPSKSKAKDNLMYPFQWLLWVYTRKN